MKTSVTGTFCIVTQCVMMILIETPYTITADTWTKNVLTFPGTDTSGWRSLGTDSGCL